MKTETFWVFVLLCFQVILHQYNLRSDRNSGHNVTKSSPLVFISIAVQAPHRGSISNSYSVVLLKRTLFYPGLARKISRC